MSNIKIKSSIKTYGVNFLEKEPSFEKYSKEDVIVVDRNVYQAWGNLFLDISAQVIKINATEEQKSYYEIGKIIDKMCVGLYHL